MRFGILGPVVAWEDGAPVNIGSPQQRGVLAALLLGKGRQVPTEEIILAVWGAHAPARAVQTVRTYVSRLRRLLGEDRQEIHTEGGGYRLEADPAEVDVTAFRQHVATARATGDPEEAARELRLGCALWRDTALAGLDGAFFAGRRRWLEQLRESALEEQWELDLERGRLVEVITALTAATAAEPFQERRWELLIDALARNGQAEQAASAYHRISLLLDAELGLNPGEGLQRAYARLGPQRTEPGRLTSP
ncbi:AfsR/SARP family transcriptional regulator [Amycolatopsis benzoatilytica]|uniref:AfsR/SARP family transcriptional regulator n=1 Tax=Amycolatopsis benzoatilytica TaxID=346045 RepID=UPI00035FA72C|nr:BTAD domain-containing putative transcriptional regulator [Amycolatopsis benzoatilytica]